MTEEHDDDRAAEMDGHGVTEGKEAHGEESEADGEGADEGTEPHEKNAAFGTDYIRAEADEEGKDENDLDDATY